MNAQGEDVVMARTPQPVSACRQPGDLRAAPGHAAKLESHYREMQDIEFTIEALYILQCRAGKRTGAAAVKIAVDMVNEGLISKTGPARAAGQLEQLLHPRLVNDQKAKPTPGSTPAWWCCWPHRPRQGRRSAWLRSAGDPSARNQPDDLGGMSSKGVLTQLGGRTARRADRPPVWHSHRLWLRRHPDNEQVRISTDGSVKEGDVISIDGTMGEVYVALTKPATVTGDFATFMGWVDELHHGRARQRRYPSRPRPSASALKASACATEHMFLGDRAAGETMIMAENEADRDAALAKLLPLQRE